LFTEFEAEIRKQFAGVALDYDIGEGMTWKTEAGAEAEEEQDGTATGGVVENEGLLS